MSDFDLNALLEKALDSKEPSLDKLAKSVFRKVPATEYEALARRYVRFMLGSKERFRRADSKPRNKPKVEAEANGHSPPGRPWYEQDRPQLEGVRFWISPKRPEVFYADLTPDDCHALGVERERQGDALLAESKFFFGIERRLRDASAARVGDLAEVPSLPLELAA